jgi:hypothetical protein
MSKLYTKYDPDTYHSRDLFRIVCETRDLRPVWAYKNANKWGVDYEPFLKLCGDTCSCCSSSLNYGLGKNNLEDKLDIHTPSTDHVISRHTAKSLGWPIEKINNISNMWIICKRCNLLKNNSTADDIHRYKSIIAVLERRAGIDGL